MSGLPAELIDRIAIRIGELTLSGIGINKQAELLSEEFGTKLNHAHITRYKSRPSYKNYLAEASEEIKKQSIAELVRRVSKLIPMIESTIIKNLEDGNINAVPHALKILGLGEEVKSNGQQQALTVVMPGAKPPKDVIDIKEATNSDDTEN